MKILIIGGGIGGLSAALCCAHFGHDVQIFERASQLGEVGAGIQVPPNAMKVFEALRIKDLIAQHAFRPEAIEARMGESGRTLFTVPLAAQALSRWGSPYLHIHRADYIDALKTALAQRAPDALILGAECVGYDQSGSGVTLRLGDGRSFTGDVMIGADGIKSPTRAQMHGPDTPIFTGNVAWRAVVPIDALGAHKPNPTACAWMGKGRHGVTYRLRGGTLANFVGVVERDGWTEEGWSVPGRREEALSDFAGWHDDVTHIIKACDPTALFKWALFDRAPLASWVEGRVTLLGDAAHPMLPFMAQGAAMAVEDAWVVAQELSAPNRPVNASLLAYQAARLARTSALQAASRANMKTFHQRTKLGQLKTYGPMWLAGKTTPWLVHKRLDWLYKYDVTSGS